MTIQTNHTIDASYRVRVEQARAGLPVSEALAVMKTWNVSVAHFAAILGTSERKWSRLRSKSGDTVLNPVESDRLLRLMDVLKHALTVFDSEADAVRWFQLTSQSLSGDSPLSLMDTDAGVHEVDAVLTRIEFGVFA